MSYKREKKKELHTYPLEILLIQTDQTERHRIPGGLTLDTEAWNYTP